MMRTLLAVGALGLAFAAGWMLGENKRGDVAAPPVLAGSDGSGDSSSGANTASGHELTAGPPDALPQTRVAPVGLPPLPPAHGVALPKLAGQDSGATPLPIDAVAEVTPPPQDKRFLRVARKLPGVRDAWWQGPDTVGLLVNDAAMRARLAQQACSKLGAGVRAVSAQAPLTREGRMITVAC